METILSEKFDADVIIAGAGIAGCAAAILYARLGLSVILIDRVKSIEGTDNKFSPYIHSGFVPIIERLGLKEGFRSTGARNGIQIWTPWGWIKKYTKNDSSQSSAYGWCIKREDLLSIMRHKAASFSGVRLNLNCDVKDVIIKEKKVVGLKTSSKNFHAHLVIAADGSNSTVARRAKVPTQEFQNNKTGVYGYFSNVSLSSSSESQAWLLNNSFAYLFDHGKDVLACCYIKDSEFKYWKKNGLEKSFFEFFSNLNQNNMQLQDANKIGDLYVKKVIHKKRPPSYLGIALIGDATVVADPSSAVGCGWAMQSAQYLVDETAKAILNRSPKELEKSLKEYSKKVKKKTWFEAKMIYKVSQSNKFSTIWKILLYLSVRNKNIGDSFLLFVSRNICFRKFIKLVTTNIFTKNQGNL